MELVPAHPLPQVVSSGCGAHEVGEWYDTISGQTCVIRFPMIGIGGRTVVHCHVLSHEVEPSSLILFCENFCGCNSFMCMLSDGNVIIFLVEVVYL